MEKSETIKELAAAMAKFQGEVPAVKFDEKVKVTMKSGGSYTFSYASMGAIKETCRPILAKNGLAVMQLIGEKHLTTMLTHESGEYISEALELRIRDNMTPQEIGSLITYMKRYSYSAVLGLVTDEDEDGNIASGHQASKPALKPLKEDTEDYTKVFEYLSKGGSINEVKKRFTVSETVHAKLLSELKTQ